MAYLSYHLLGDNGRLGNQMFQYAALLGAARKLDMTPVANLSKSKLIECFVLGSVQEYMLEKPSVIYLEPHFQFSSKLFELSSISNTSLHGYFQSEKNFLHIKDEIKANFIFKSKIKQKAMTCLPDKKTVSVHIRRGDYVGNDKFHKNQTVAYYKKALARFEGYLPIIFSDDIEWCKEQLRFLDNAHYFSDEGVNHSADTEYSSFVDLCAMSLCDAHIVANSSFSWWGAWLGQGLTVAPKKWFGKRGPKDWRDIYCEQWEVL